MMKTIKEIEKAGTLSEESRAFIMSRIPARYQEVDIDQCRDEVKAWIFGKKEKKGLYMWGPVGTGKTYSAYAIYKLIAWNGVRARVTNSTALLNDIRDDFTASASRDSYYQSKFDAWVDFKGVLIIDDIGSEKPTEWALQTFYSLINTRYEADLPTIFTSNHSIEELAGRLGDRIASRIVEMCDVKKIDGADRRIK